MIKYNNFPIFLLLVGLSLFILQIQLNYHASYNLKIFELFNVVLFCASIPLFFLRKLNKKNLNILIILIFIIIFCNLIILLKYTDLLNFINSYNILEYKLWRFYSVYSFLSIIFLSCFFLILNKKELFVIFKIFYYFGIFIIIEAFLHASISLLGFESIWKSDILSGYRFQSILLLDSSETALTLFISYLYFLSIKKFKFNLKNIFVILLFLISIILTKERSIILLFIIFNFLFLLKNFKESKLLIIFLIILIPILTFNTLSLIRTSADNSHGILKNFEIKDDFQSNLNFDLFNRDKEIYNPTTAFSIKSTISRIVLLMRSFEISNEFFPFGTGPGSQLFFIYNDSIDFKIFNEIINNPNPSSFVYKLLVHDIRQFQIKTGYLDSCKFKSNTIQNGRYVYINKGCVNINGKLIRTMSTHNLFADLIISLGIIGIIFSIMIIITMFLKFNYFILSNISLKSITSLGVSMFFVMFIFGSYYNAFWVFIFLLTFSNFDNEINEEY